MDCHCYRNNALKKESNRIKFKRDSIPKDIRTIEYEETRRQHEQEHQGQQAPTLEHESTRLETWFEDFANPLNLDEVPPLFRCKSSEEIRDVVKAGKGAVVDIFRGYNLLHWYCNAKSTSPGIIQELLRRGIDINAVDQRAPKRHGPVVRHTALGYACRNANVKAVHTLLQNGADVCGLVKPARPSGLLKQDAYGNPIVYPSPLQELLCQPIHGPRPGRCPWLYHLSAEDEQKDAYLDEDDPEMLPAFRALSGSSGLLSEHGPVCKLCAADFHIWEPWPETEEEKVARRERRRSCYYSQIQRLGNRLHACVQLLLNYGCSDPPVAFPEFDDSRLWSGIDCLLETFWHFVRPLAICERKDLFPEGTVLISHEHLLQIVSQPFFLPFGGVCDMLVESAGYETKRIPVATRGLDRLIRLISEHSEFSSFRQGEYFDVDTQLEKELLRSSLTSR